MPAGFFLDLITGNELEFKLKNTKSIKSWGMMHITAKTPKLSAREISKPLTRIFVNDFGHFSKHSSYTFVMNIFYYSHPILNINCVKFAKMPSQLLIKVPKDLTKVPK